MIATGSDLEYLKKKFIGNTLFYTFLIDYRAPLFLERNIRAFFQKHEKRIQRLRATQAAEAQDDCSMAADSPVPKWNFKEIQQLLAQRTFTSASPVLRIEVIAIRDRLARFRESNGNEEPASKSARAAPIAGNVSLTIWSSTTATPETIVEQTKRCTIERRPKSSGERYASVALAEPFVVRLEQLRTSAAGRHLPPEDQNFSMQLVITAASADDEWPPVPVKTAEPRTPFIRDTGGLVRFPLFVAKWPRLPRCPETEQESLLEITTIQDGQQYKPKLSLKIDASWCAPTSPLTLVNREFKDCLSVNGNSNGKSNGTEHLKPPRVSPQPSEESQPDIVVATEWEFEGLSSFLPRNMLDGYVCVLCKNRVFSSSDLLHFHIHTSHDLFAFKYSVRHRRSSIGQTLSDVLVKVTSITVLIPKSKSTRS